MEERGICLMEYEQLTDEDEDENRWMDERISSCMVTLLHSADFLPPCIKKDAFQMHSHLFDRN